MRKILIYKDKDGIIYSINPENFKIERYDIDFKFSKNESNNEANNISTLELNDDLKAAYLMLTQKDIENLKTDSNNTSENKERRYLCKLNLTDAKIENIIEDVFLDGGIQGKFNKEKESILKKLDKSSKFYEKIRDIASRAKNEKIEPISINSDQRIITHKSCIDDKFSLNLSLVDLKMKKLIWTIDTKSKNIYNIFQDNKKLIVFCNSSYMDTTFNSNFILNIDLNNGKFVGYDLLYERFF